MPYNFNLDFSNVLGSGAFDFSGMSFGEPVGAPEPTKQAPKVITRPDPLDVVSERSDPIEDAINNLADKGSIDLGLDFSVAPIDLTAIPTQVVNNVEPSGPPQTTPVVETAAPPTVAPSNATPAQSGVNGVNTGGAMESTSNIVDLTQSPGSTGTPEYQTQSNFLGVNGDPNWFSQGALGQWDGGRGVNPNAYNPGGQESLTDPRVLSIMNDLGLTDSGLEEWNQTLYAMNTSDIDPKQAITDITSFLDTRVQQEYDQVVAELATRGITNIPTSKIKNSILEKYGLEAGATNQIDLGNQRRLQVDAQGNFEYVDNRPSNLEVASEIAATVFTTGALTMGLGTAISSAPALSGLSATTANAVGGGLASGAVSAIKGGDAGDIGKAVLLGGFGGALKGASIDADAAETALGQALDNYGSYSNEYQAALDTVNKTSSVLEILSDADKLFTFGTAIDEGKDPLKALVSVYGDDIANYALPYLADMAGEYVGETYGTDVVMWLRDNEKLVDTGVRLAGGERPLSVITDIYGEDALDYLEIDSNVGRATGFGLMATAVSLDEGNPPEFALLDGLKEFYDRDGLKGAGSWVREQLRAFDDNVIQKFLDMLPEFDFGDGADIDWSQLLPEFEGFDLSGFELPDVDLGIDIPSIDVDFNVPDIDLGLEIPDINVPDFEAPNVELPDLPEIPDLPDLPEFNGPDFNDVGLNGPSVETPGLTGSASMEDRTMNYMYDSSDILANPLLRRDTQRIRNLAEELQLDPQEVARIQQKVIDDEEDRVLRAKKVYTPTVNVGVNV